MGGEMVEVVSCGNRQSSGVLEVRQKDGSSAMIQLRNVRGVLSECVVWDLPGTGTGNFPQATYLKRVGLRHFDVVVLMTASRFTEAELMLVEELRYWNVPYFLVRTKIDVAVEAEVEEQKEADDNFVRQEREKDIAEETISSIKSYFSSTYGLDDVYCISSRPQFRN